MNLDWFAGCFTAMIEREARLNLEAKGIKLTKLNIGSEMLDIANKILEASKPAPPPPVSPAIQAQLDETRQLIKDFMADIELVPTPPEPLPPKPVSADCTQCVHSCLDDTAGKNRQTVCLLLSQENKMLCRIVNPKKSAAACRYFQVPNP